MHYTYDDESKPMFKETRLYVDHGIIYEDFLPHTHDFNETFVILDGSAEHVIGERHYTVERGDVFAIKGDLEHALFNIGDRLELFNLQYDPALFSRPNSELRMVPGFDEFFITEPEIRRMQTYPATLKLDESSLEYVTHISDFIVDLQERRDRSVCSVIRLTFQALLGFIATNYVTKGTAGSGVSVLSKAVSYMERHLAMPIRLEDVAGEVFVSARQLERLFSHYYHVTPMKYLQSLRLNNAIGLLMNGADNVSQAAQKSGFEDINYFTRVFKECYGVTPSAVKKHIHTEKLKLPE